jgi:hypothetical protein
MQVAALIVVQVPTSCLQPLSLKSDEEDDCGGVEGVSQSPSQPPNESAQADAAVSTAQNVAKAVVYFFVNVFFLIVFTLYYKDQK